MGDVVLTCGHKAKPDDGPRGLGWLITVIYYDRQDERGESTMSVCTNCRDYYADSGLIIKEHDHEPS